MTINLNHSMIDKIRIRQPNDGSYPILNNGQWIKINQDASAIEYTKNAWLTHNGSFDTSMQIRVDENNLVVDYNPSAWNKPDNIFGLKIEQVFTQFDNILRSLGQPPLQESTCCLSQTSKHINYEYTGPQVMLIDLTVNLATGSPENLEDFFLHLGQLKINKLAPRTKKNTVYWGSHGRGLLIKAYRKATEVHEHKIYKFKSSLPASEAYDHLQYLKQQRDQLKRYGVARIELSLGWRYLDRKGLRSPSELTQEKLNRMLNEVIQQMSKDIPKIELGKLTNTELGTLLMHQKGIVVKDRLSHATFYKHRNRLLQLGVDIAISNENITQLSPRQKVITLRAYEPPVDYDWGDQEDLLEN